jgi:hypothetical protein
VPRGTGGGLRAGRGTVGSGLAARQVLVVTGRNEDAGSVCWNPDFSRDDAVVREDDGQRGHRSAAGAAKRALVFRRLLGRSLLLLLCVMRGVFFSSGLLVMGVRIGCLGLLVHRARLAVPGAHRTVRRVGSLVTALRSNDVRRPVRIAAIQRHERRQRHHLERQPGDDREPKAPAEAFHDVDQLNRIGERGEAPSSRRAHIRCDRGRRETYTTYPGENRPEYRDSSPSGTMLRDSEPPTPGTRLRQLLRARS